MAKPRKQSKLPGVKYVKTDKNYLDFLKRFTNWFTKRNKKSEDIENLLEHYQVEESTAFSRIVSHCYTNPHIIWYLNKYFNNLYEFSKFKAADLFQSIAYVLDSNQHNTNKSFYYLKSSEQKDNNKQKVKKVIKEYYRYIYEKHINDLELNFYYNLFLNNIITAEEILEMAKDLDGDESKIKLDDVNIARSHSIGEDEEILITKTQIDEYFEHSRTRTLPEPIRNFCEALKKFKSECPTCKTCKLFNKDMVVLDTNLDEPGIVDFFFIALNPGVEEPSYGKPLVGKAGRLIREKLFFLNPKIKWIITNIILCTTKDQNEIGKKNDEILQVARNCSALVHQIFNAFFSTYFVPMGGPAAEYFGVKGSITEKCGQLFTMENGCKTLPLVHPSAILRGNANFRTAWDYGWENIYQMSNNIHPSNFADTNTNQKVSVSNKTEINIPTISTGRIPAHKLISEITEDLTLFDVTSIDNHNILMIFIDKMGDKKYLIKDFKTPVYIKTGSNWKDNTVITEHTDIVAYLNRYERMTLTKEMKDSMTTLKMRAISPKRE